MAGYRSTTFKVYCSFGLCWWWSSIVLWGVVKIVGHHHERCQCWSDGLAIGICRMIFRFGWVRGFGDLFGLSLRAKLWSVMSEFYDSFKFQRAFWTSMALELRMQLPMSHQFPNWSKGFVAKRTGGSFVTTFFRFVSVSNVSQQIWKLVTTIWACSRKMNWHVFLFGSWFQAFISNIIAIFIGILKLGTLGTFVLDKLSAIVAQFFDFGWFSIGLNLWRLFPVVRSRVTKKFVEIVEFLGRYALLTDLPICWIFLFSMNGINVIQKIRVPVVKW